MQFLPVGILHCVITVVPMSPEGSAKLPAGLLLPPAMTPPHPPPRSTLARVSSAILKDYPSFMLISGYLGPRGAPPQLYVGSVDLGEHRCFIVPVPNGPERQRVQAASGQLVSRGRVSASFSGGGGLNICHSEEPPDVWNDAAVLIQTRGRRWSVSSKMAVR